MDPVEVEGEGPNHRAWIAVGSPHLAGLMRTVATRLVQGGSVEVPQVLLYA